MTIRLGIQGASGKTGGLILSVLDEFPHYVLTAAIVGPDCKTVGSTAYGNIRYENDPRRDIAATDCWIDFSMPSSSVEIATLCAEHRKPLLIATTGHSEAQLHAINKAAERCPILIAANTSVGVFALKEISLLTQQILGPCFDIEISEMHHKHKKDAPSGTANYLAKSLCHNGEDLVYDRSPRDESRRDGEIGVTSIRGGDVAGEHTIYFIGNGERIELTQRAWDRKVYARGALFLAERFLQKKYAAGIFHLTRELFLP